MQFDDVINYSRSTISSEAVRTRYYQLIARSYISSNLMYKWCPHPGCGNCAEVFSLDVKHIVCSCGMEVCQEFLRWDILSLVNYHFAIFSF